MSGKLFELGVRLRAAESGEPVAVAVFAPVLPPVSPVAAVVDSDGEHVFVTATDGSRTLSGTDEDALSALAELGAALRETHRTLVVGSLAELGVLADLAGRFRDAPASAVIGWWDQRADHPGTEAVFSVSDAARLRWVLGVHPDRERDVDTWKAWLGVGSTGPQALLDLAYLIASGSTLPGLLSASEADAKSWGRYCERVEAGKAWWMPDSRIDAAMGLITRSHAAEWFESLRLDDPLVAAAGAHEGTVVPGRVAAVRDKAVVIEADRALSRLRADSQVTAWLGDPVAAGGASCLDGWVGEATIGADGRLTITVGELRRRPQGIKPGDRVCLRPARVDPFMQARGRSLMASGYRRGANWIAGRGKPVPRRGDVPLDVMVAAADD